MSIPNLLTVMRFLIVPVFGYYLFTKQYSYAFCLFIFAGITDILDGYLARKFNMVTPFGEFADPLADKLVQATAIAVLAYNGIVPLFVLAIVATKEIAMGLGAYILYRNRKVVVAANWYGKLAAVVLYVAIFCAIIFKLGFLASTYSPLIVKGLFLLGIVSTLFALMMYAINYQKVYNSSDSTIE